MSIKDSEDSEMLVKEVYAIMKKYDRPISAPAIRKMINNAGIYRKTTDGEVTYALENVLIPSKIADKMVGLTQFRYYLIKRRGDVNDAIKKEIEKGNSKKISPVQEAARRVEEGKPNTAVPIGNGNEIYIKPTTGQLVDREEKNTMRKKS
jgi:hypothetical protein